MLSTNLHTRIIRSSTNWVKSAATCAFANGNFVRHTLSQQHCVFPMQGETQIVQSLCYNPQMESVGSVGVRDSLTEKRRDSHIFRGPEIHYTVTRTTGTVMVGMLEV